MEAIKDIKEENGVPQTNLKQKEVKENEVVDTNEITKEDLSNLKQIFTWALTVTTKDRKILKSIVIFEEALFKKLTNKSK